VLTSVNTIKKDRTGVTYTAGRGRTIFGKEKISGRMSRTYSCVKLGTKKVRGEGESQHLAEKGSHKTFNRRYKRKRKKHKRFRKKGQVFVGEITREPNFVREKKGGKSEWAELHGTFPRINFSKSRGKRERTPVGFSEGKEGGGTASHRKVLNENI